jgi:SAM-dependent methyltransferase
VDFLFDVYEVIKGDEPLSFVELGSGPSQHSLEMAESKLDVYAVEISPTMIEYSKGLAAADDLKLAWLEQDMRSFKLPVRILLAASLP